MARERRSTIGLLTLAVALSGGASLVYQAAWIRHLITVTSAVVSAQATVLAVFMSGLGLGSYLAANRASRLRRPLLAYALVELLAAAFAALAMPVIGASPLLVPMLAGWAPTGLAAHWPQLLLVGLFLLIPTVLLGVSLPLVIAHVERGRTDRGIVLGLLYGFNTLGAALGVGLAGYVTIEQVGLIRTAFIGCALAAGASTIAWVVSRQPTRVPRERESQPDPGRLEPRFFWAAFLAGAVGLGAEVLWTRLIALVVMNTVYAFTQVLACVLIGVALGGYLAAAVVRWGGERALGWLCALQSLAAVFILAVPAALTWLSVDQALFVTLARGTSPAALFTLMVMLVPPAALTGSALPLLAACSRLPEGSRAFGLLYTSNAAGSVVGSLLAGFVLLPLVGTHTGLLTLGCASLGVALLVLPSLRSPGWAAVPVGVSGVICVGLYGRVDVPREILSARIGPDARIVDLREGTSSDVMITDDALGRRRIWINSVWVAGTGGRHRLLGHLPALFVGRPGQGLGVALGTGQTFGTVFKHGFSRFDCVEIDPEVIALSTRWFADYNGRLFERPGVHLHHADGRAFLRATHRKFDLIVLEPLQAWTAGTSALYSREFYLEARRALAPGGVVAQWIPFYGQELPETRAMVRAGLEVFPQASLWLDLHDGILILHDEPFAIRPAALEARVVRRGLRSEFAADHVEHIGDLVALLLAGPKGLRAWTRGADLLQDDHPFLEFRAARSIGTSAFVPILRSLRPHLEDLASLDSERTRASRRALETAGIVRHALVGSSLEAKGDFAARARHLASGLRKARASGLLRARYRAVVLQWGSSPGVEQDTQQLEGIYKRALRTDPGFAEAGVNLALAYAEAGRNEEAIAVAEGVRHVERTRPVVDEILRRLAERH